MRVLTAIPRSHIRRSRSAQPERIELQFLSLGRLAGMPIMCFFVMVRLGAIMRASSSAFEALVGLAYESVEEPDLWEAILRRLREGLGCSGAIFQTFDVRTCALRLTSPLGFDEAWLADYERNWKSTDRLYHSAADIIINGWRRKDGEKVAVDAIMTARFVLGEDNYQSGPQFEEKFRPADLGDYVALPVRNCGHVTTGIGLWAPVRRKRFTDEELTFCRRIVPHLSRAARVGDAVRRAKAIAAPPTPSEDATVDAIFIVDQTQTVLSANARARAMLEKSDFVKSIDGRLTFASAKLSAAIGRFADAHKPPLSEFVASICGRKVHATPLQSRAESGRRGGLAEFVVTISRSALRDAVSPGLCRFGLTAVETEIAKALARGEAPREISARRSTSIATTRWHIRQIYEKMQVCNLHEFLREAGAANVEEA